MAIATIGNSSITWATTAETWGFIENLSEGEEVQIKEEYDNDGDITGVAFFGKKHPVSGTYIHLSDTSAPTSQIGTGTTITVQDVSVNSGAIHITSVTEELTGGSSPGAKRVNFQGFYWPALGV